MEKYGVCTSRIYVNEKTASSLGDKCFIIREKVCGNCFSDLDNVLFCPRCKKTAPTVVMEVETSPEVEDASK